MPGLGFPHREPDVDCPFRHTVSAHASRKHTAKPVGLVEHYQVDMISRRAGGALLILLLVLSVSLKVLQSHDESAAGDVAEGVSTFLARNGFAIERRASDEDLFLVSATASECRLLVAVLSPEGWHRDVIRKLAPSDSQLIFVYNGIIYADQPTMLTRFNEYSESIGPRCSRSSPFLPGARHRRFSQMCVGRHQMERAGPLDTARSETKITFPRTAD